jgi:2-keto-3-deoxy-galactonokinase
VTEREAFRTLVHMAQARMNAHKVRAKPMTKQQRRRLRALLIGADFIAQMSGSYHSEAMIWNAEPALYEQLQKMLKMQEDSDDEEDGSSDGAAPVS